MGNKTSKLEQKVRGPPTREEIYGLSHEQGANIHSMITDTIEKLDNQLAAKTKTKQDLIDESILMSEETISKELYQKECKKGKFAILVEGYIHEFRKKYKYVIPWEINSLCLMYYFEPMDRFSTKYSSSYMCISEDMLTSTNITRRMGRHYSFGKEIIRIGGSDNMVFSWTFKVIRFTDTFSIGIESVNESSVWGYSYKYRTIKRVTSDSVKREGVLIRKSDGIPREGASGYGPDIQDDDTIVMILNTKRKYVCFGVNGNQIKEDSKFNETSASWIAFSDIENMQFRMFIYMDGDWDSISIVNVGKRYLV